MDIETLRKHGSKCKPLETGWVLTKTGSDATLRVPVPFGSDNRGWIARVTGRDTAHGLAREFLKHNRGTYYGLQPGIYDYDRIATTGQSSYSYNKYGGTGGWFAVLDDWRMIGISEAVILRIASDLDAARNPAPPLVKVKRTGARLSMTFANAASAEAAEITLRKLYPLSAPVAVA